jgi:hypothetical protein
MSPPASRAARISRSKAHCAIIFAEYKSDSAAIRDEVHE